MPHKLHVRGRIIESFEVGLSAHAKIRLENREVPGDPFFIDDVEALVDTGFSGELVIDHDIAHSLGIPVMAENDEQSVQNGFSALLRKILGRGREQSVPSNQANPASAVTTVTFGDGRSGEYKVHPVYIVCRHAGVTTEVVTEVVVDAIVIPKRNISKRTHEAVLGMQAMAKCRLNVFIDAGSTFIIS